MLESFDTSICPYDGRCSESWRIRLRRLLLRCLCCGWKYLHRAFLPKSFGDLQRFDIQVVPPGHFVTGLMQLLMVLTAERHGDPIRTLRFCSFYAASALSAI